MHVPPRRFVRIRHYGLLCSRTKSQKLTLCRNLLGCKNYLSKLRDMEMPEILEHLYGIKVCVCKGMWWASRKATDENATALLKSNI